MNNNNVKHYASMLVQRRLSRRIQELSFNLSLIEQEFNIRDLSPADISQLKQSYNQLFNELIELSNEVKKHISGGMEGA